MLLVRFENSIKVRIFITYIDFLRFCETTITISYLVLSTRLLSSNTEPSCFKDSD